MDIDKKLVDKWCEEIKGKGSLEQPVLGEILTPLCKVCKNADFHYGTWDAPECSVYGQMPKEIIDCKSYDCPHFEKDEKSNWCDFFTFDENGKPSPKRK